MSGGVSVMASSVDDGGVPEKFFITFTNNANGTSFTISGTREELDAILMDARAALSFVDTAH